MPIERRMKNLIQKLRSGDLDDPVRSKGPHDCASYLVDHDPPAGWNYFDKKTSWSEKWIISMSLGPWKEDRTQEVMATVLSALKKQPLSKLQRAERLPFPKLKGDWQWEWTINLSEYLRDIDWSDAGFFSMLKEIEGGGLACRAAIRAICGAWGPCKTVDFFIREALYLEVIPIDRHVERILRSAGLGGLRQEHLIAECKRLGVKPQRFARAVFRAYSPLNEGK